MSKTFHGSVINFSLQIKCQIFNDILIGNKNLQIRTKPQNRIDFILAEFLFRVKLNSTDISREKYRETRR